MKRLSIFLYIAFLGLTACKQPADEKVDTNATNEAKVDTTNESVKKAAGSVMPASDEGVDHIVFKFDAASNDYQADKAFLATLPEPEKAILAYYAASANAGCDLQGNCKLTEALGLGKQGSKEHQDLLTKWFKKDKKVEDFIKKKFAVTQQGDPQHKLIDNLQLRRESNEVDVRFLYKFITKDREGMQEGEDAYEIDKNQGVIRLILHKVLHEDIPPAMQEKAQSTTAPRGVKVRKK